MCSGPLRQLRSVFRAHVYAWMTHVFLPRGLQLCPANRLLIIFDSCAGIQPPYPQLGRISCWDPQSPFAKVYIRQEQEWRRLTSSVTAFPTSLLFDGDTNPILPRLLPNPRRSETPRSSPPPHHGLNRYMMLIIAASRQMLVTSEGTVHREMSETQEECKNAVGGDGNKYAKARAPKSARRAPRACFRLKKRRNHGRDDRLLLCTER